MMKISWILFIVVLLFASCASQLPNQPVEPEAPIHALIDLAYKRASEPIELGGEKDELIVETMAKAIRGTDESDLVDELKQLPPKEAASLRLFFKPSDFEGRGLLLGKRPMPTMLEFLNSLPPMPPCPMETATAEAWMKPNMRLDWKSVSGSNPSASAR